ncbi:MAG TPA: hypothetical protein VFO73_12435 [Candidatus Limnocylindrales bacterium]|jgi:hypothetical protein|nr:hypothetical protein [Candidatus Limnocylindrales bacterium]
MSTQPSPAGPTNPFTAPMSRRTVRNFAAAVAAVTALLYALIGVEVLTIVQPGTNEEGDLLMFGLPAAGAFLIGALLLVLFDNRALWALGAILQVLVIVAYFAFAGVRTPQFELWGILIKVSQLALLGALVWLAIRAPDEATVASERP